MSVELRWIGFESDEYEQMLRLRDEVLRKPLGRKQERKDESHLHLLTAWQGDALVGCLTLDVEPNQRGRMRAVAVDPQVQGQGVGAVMVEELERRAGGLGCIEVYAHARQTVVGFYKAVGYMVEPEVFEEVSIPHQVIRKAIG